MKKLLVFSLLGSSLFLGTNSLKADDYDTFGYQYSGDASIGSYIYGIDNATGARTRLTTRLFEGNSISGAHVSANTGELIFKTGSAKTYEAYNWETNSWRTFEIDDATETVSGALTLVERPSTAGGPSDSSLVLSNDGDGELIRVKANEITAGGDSNETMIKKNADGSIHIGKNSWITKEENGRQKVYAKDAAGNPIPIDYTNGTKLLINGRDVEQSINNVGALSAALTGLPTVPTDTTLACGFGTGTHGGDFAFAGGCASKMNEKLSLNYAASMTMPGQDYAGDFIDTFSARAGFVWKLGKPVKPTLISMKAKEKMEEKIYTLEENNKKIISQNTDLKQKNQSIISQNKELLARLERLEKVALGESKSKDLATIKLP